jgi:hypothetical protein
MKLILTGVTGFIGGEVLSQSIRNPAVTSIIALSRRKLPEIVNDPKLEVVLMEDFNTYPDSVLRNLSGADACIWYIPRFGAISSLLRSSRCMGTTAGDRTLEIDYPLAFGNAFSNILQEDKNFRYIHLSGAATERDQGKPLWFKADMRKMKVGKVAPFSLELTHFNRAKQS